MRAVLGCSALAFCTLRASAQLAPPGTTDVPIQREGICGSNGGDETYANRGCFTKNPNFKFSKVCPSLGGADPGAEVYFNDPCVWAHGQAQLTVAHFRNMCKGATRMIHWHNQADEWGYLKKGRLQLFAASPDGLPWPASNNIISDNGVWFFPSNFLHSFMCLTPESEGGCEMTLVFASPVPAEPNGHNLDTTLDQAPDSVSAAALGPALGLNASSYEKLHPAFRGAATKETSLVNVVAQGVCDPECPPVIETTALPAGIDTADVEKVVHAPGGVVLRQIKTTQFPFSRTMSQERTQLPPGGQRQLSWMSADAVLIVTEGTVTVSIQGGLLSNEAHKAYTEKDLVEGDVMYVPNGKAFWLQESTGKAKAETIMVFNVGEWKTFDAASQIQLMPKYVVEANVHKNETLVLYA